MADLPQSEQPWPADGLEQAPNCPLCGSNDRALLHDHLSDAIFFTAPGQWTLWRCGRCRSAWLDPRPTEATIGLAYGRYYTHDESEPSPPRNALQRLRASLGNGYRNRRYGARLSPSSSLGALLGALLPPLRRPVDIAYRFLPPPSRDRRRVLDIGCGNGAFLVLARGAGWQVAGAEPDPIAREQAEVRGIEVRASAAEWLDQPASFDFVTISHVIEHVHDPLRLLHDCFDLLRPGGGIYIDTPNIDGLGHRLYGRHWRGLEPPRHLVLFNRESLRAAVAGAGFTTVAFHGRPDAFAFTSAQSRRIAAGRDPYNEDGAALPRPGIVQRLRARVDRSSDDFLTLTAAKPR